MRLLGYHHYIKHRIVVGQYITVAVIDYSPVGILANAPQDIVFRCRAIGIIQILKLKQFEAVNKPNQYEDKPDDIFSVVIHHQPDLL